ncbi:uncharacterized protein BDZ99DRAFT_463715 [Mytilinidion resinicola]|uniref:Uncharacterized protein n=1 Tax=Mytilinidion resinicola TaxID=574789 RepID=A0A6A6YJW4_9PEZI|nr:uncharacterized protein BDZ99DRAFT_463715 [Mytilinidion resinicola]KAF2808849.1 hypothetical protein BDZ99DRAFT_463715 [Mytilinidion resinicola]
MGGRAGSCSWLESWMGRAAGLMAGAVAGCHVAGARADLQARDGGFEVDVDAVVRAWWVW